MSNGKNILAKLRDTIVYLDIEEVKKVSEEALAAGIPAFKAVTDGMAKGMEIVGQKYEDGEYFLAELMLSTEIFKGAVSLLGPYLSKTRGPERLGKMVIATLKGTYMILVKTCLRQF